MTDLVRYEPKTSIELAPEAWSLAQKVAPTEFVPTALRGKPEAVLAAMLTGHELGIGPMQALAKIHVIEGRPSMAAELMRALVMREGHELWIEESTGTRCTVGAKRSNSTRETRVSWTLDDAKKAGLDGKQNWRKYPRTMLLARATAELCRAVFPDLLAGISYTSEELSDGDLLDAADASAPAATAPAAEPARRTARARKAATRAAPAKTVEASAVDVPPAAPSPPLPGEDGYEGQDQHLDARTYSGPQLLAIKLGELGVKDRATRLAVIGRMLGRSIESSKELTTDEISWLANALDSDDFDLEAVLQQEEPAPSGADDGNGEDVVQTAPEGKGSFPSPSSPAAPPPTVIDAVSSPAEETRSPRAPAPTADPTETIDPDGWTEQAWRTFLSARGVKVTELLREAQRLAREDGERGPATLEDLAAPTTSYAVKSLLVGFVEDRAAQRGESS